MKVATLQRILEDGNAAVVARRVAIKMPTSNAERLTARIKLSLLHSYTRDLELHRDGDTGRFDRMVGSGSVSLGNAAKWRAYVFEFSNHPLIVQYCQVELIALAPRIAGLGIGVRGYV